MSVKILFICEGPTEKNLCKTLMHYFFNKKLINSTATYGEVIYQKYKQDVRTPSLDGFWNHVLLNGKQDRGGLQGNLFEQLQRHLQGGDFEYVISIWDLKDLSKVSPFSKEYDKNRSSDSQIAIKMQEFIKKEIQELNSQNQEEADLSSSVNTLLNKYPSNPELIHKNNDWKKIDAEIKFYKPFDDFFDTFDYNILTKSCNHFHEHLFKPIETILSDFCKDNR